MPKVKTLKDMQKEKPKPEKITCSACRSTKSALSFLSTTNPRIHKHGRLPVCSDCVSIIFQENVDKLKNFHEAIHETCKLLDIAYVRKIAENTYRQLKEKDELHKNKGFGIYKKLLFAGYSGDPEEYRYINYNMNPISVNVNQPIGKKHYTDDEMIRLKAKWGTQYSVEDIEILEYNFTDWVDEYGIITKGRKSLIVDLCKIEFDINKEKPDSKSINKLRENKIKVMTAAGITSKDGDPTNEQSIGERIQEIERTEPIPKPDPIFEDVDGIKKIFKTWFMNHLLKMLGKDTSKEYDEEFEKYEKEVLSEKSDYGDDVIDMIEDDSFEQK